MPTPDNDLVPARSGMLTSGDTWTVDLAGRDAFLRHHTLHGTPLLPAAMSLALAAEAAHRPPPISFRNVVFHAPLYARATAAVSYRFVAQPPGMSIVVADAPAGPGQPPIGLTCANFELDDNPPDLPQPVGDHPDITYVTYGPYVATADLAMSGPFVTLAGLRVHLGDARARYRPRLPADPAMFPDFAICASLIDAMIQLALVSLGAGHGGMNHLLPSSCDAIHVHTPCTDRQLLARHPSGIELHAHLGGNHSTDVLSWAEPQQPIAQIIGLRAVVLSRRDP
ncbi:hypothetical protein [Amycolatopsis sp. NPDC059021]|uniref:hypothetical protein n=1 Tax=Amycolatopsis sp. NPDC059021 TaxID=3346704 RepID=UPI003670B0C9